MTPARRWLDRPVAAFFLAATVGAACVLGCAAVTLQRPAPHAPSAHPLSNDVSISEQISTDEIDALSRAGFRSIVDLRPDGEAPDQAPSADVANAAKQRGLAFAYVPVQHGDIPDATVAALASKLRALPKPVLLYCRSGRRAARTWALVEASRVGGLDANAIAAAVKSAGQNDDDLGAEIASRIAARSTAP
jgi:uncharacterized protein (TIGR01244 family)